MVRIPALLAIALSGFALHCPTRAAAQTGIANSWTVGNKTIVATEVSNQPLQANTPDWRLRASAVTEDAQGRHVHTLSVFFGVAQIPGPGRYHIVSADSALHADEAAFIAKGSWQDGAYWSYSSTGTGNHYLTVTVRNGRVEIAMPPAPAYSDDATGGGIYIGAQLVETEGK